MGDMYHFDKNLSSSQDEISLFLRQILLRSSSSSSPLQDGTISALDSSAFLSPSSQAPASAANVSSSSLGLSGNDTDDYDCESEEGAEALTEEVPTKSLPSRSSSKRSRAAEVHNLSEKVICEFLLMAVLSYLGLILFMLICNVIFLVDFYSGLGLIEQRRRSRINEKMKALQNLIPNSNKTDKASMLDEAIEYLKQLQLQVQMLSMRNGLSMHPMCFPEGLQPLQLSRMSTELGEGNRSTPSNMTATLPLPQENPLLYASNSTNKHTLPNQLSVPYPSYINNTQTSFRLESRIPAQTKPLHRSSEPIHDMLQHQQSNANHSDTNPLGGSPVVKEFESGTLATVSLSFDMGTSEPKDNNSLQTCIAGTGRDHSGEVMRDSEPNIMLKSQLSR